ncbi:MAG: hypothetical protein ABIR11_04225, partial [Candidatus Limnocylindrales bacterium]
MSSRSVTLRASSIVAVLAMTLAACGAVASTATPRASDQVPTPVPATPSTVPDASPSAPDAAAPGLLLEVTTEGGFISPVASLGSVPAVVVDTDGKIYTPGLAAGDPTLVTPVLVRDTGAAGAAAILDALKAAGLDHEQSGGGVAVDTGTTVFTAGIDGDLLVSRFVPTGGPGRPGQPAASGAPGAAAFDLLARLADPTVAWGGSAGSVVPYVPVGYRVWAAPLADGGGSTGGGGSAGPAPVWPLVTPLGAFGSPAAATF